jgi:hypothetical protein
MADPEVFEVFVKMLQQHRMLSFLNTGEIRLSEHQMERLKVALKKSTVTHMFCECSVCSADDKIELRGIVRANQRKHRRWESTNEQGAKVTTQQSIRWKSAGSIRRTTASTSLQ